MGCLIYKSDLFLFVGDADHSKRSRNQYDVKIAFVVSVAQDTEAAFIVIHLISFSKYFLRCCSCRQRRLWTLATPTKFSVFRDRQRFILYKYLFEGPKSPEN